MSKKPNLTPDEQISVYLTYKERVKKEYELSEEESQEWANVFMKNLDKLIEIWRNKEMLI